MMVASKKRTLGQGKRQYLLVVFVFLSSAYNNFSKNKNV